MKKFILTFVLVLTASLSVYAADDTVLAEVIAVEYNSTILEVEKNTFKENEKVYLAPAGESNGVVTAVDGNIVIISLKNNGYAAGSKVVINNSARLGKAGSKKAEVKAVKLNSIVLDVKNNTFKVQDEVKLTPDGEYEAVVKTVNQDIIIISSNNIGYAEGSKLLVTKTNKKFNERFSEKAKK